MDDIAREREGKQLNRKVQNIEHTCSAEGCECAAPYGFKEDEATGIYRWYCSDHIGEGEIILSDGSKRLAVRGRG